VTPDVPLLMRFRYEENDGGTVNNEWA